ncbi:hypothetical protein ACIQGZ_17510 [Streptomyces sp. NPDC092296]|uniref:hypothetical protein n=1 Tax=Streptomyces sp. NPDC092296 TaxID=3366012 RepID=UPI00381E00B2
MTNVHNESHARLAAMTPRDHDPEQLVDEGLSLADASLETMRRVVVDHIHTGLHHPDAAVQRQARALATEMDASGLNVDRLVDAMDEPRATDADAVKADIRAEGVR